MMELVKQRKRLSEPETAYFMLQLLDATRYMHAHNIIHRGASPVAAELQCYHILRL